MIDYDEDNYYDITDSSDPNLVKTVSNLRHYINCHGITNELVKYLNLTREQIGNVVEYCFGRTNIKDVIDNYEEIIEGAMEARNAKEEALMKNEELILILKDKRKTMCGVGTRRVKLMLNKLIKQDNIVAEAIRICLEIEDYNIKAKENRYYQETNYYHKEELLKQLITLCLDNGFICGKQHSDNHSASLLTYFELPNCEQISFHSNIDSSFSDKIPTYEKEWDGKVNSTLDKLESCILANFKTEIEEIIAKIEKQNNKK